MADKQSIKEKHTQEALSVGLELLDTPTGESGYKRYKVVGCGHVMNIRTNAVKKRKTNNCHICFEDVLSKFAEKIGFKFISKTDDIGYGIYTKNDCGHTLKRRFTAVRQGEVDCDICLDETFHREACDAGLTLLGISEIKGHRKYKANSCGHLIDLRLINVRNKSFKCQQCRDIKIGQDARNIGAELVDFDIIYGRGGYRKYTLPCGCEKIMSTRRVQKGYYNCQIHDQTSYTTKSSMYFIQINTEKLSWLKIGITNNFRLRIVSMKLPKSAQINIIAIREFDDRYESTKYEQIIHAKFNEFKIPKEVLKNNFMVNGYTECYPLDQKLSIFNFIENDLFQHMIN